MAAIRASEVRAVHPHAGQVRAAEVLAEQARAVQIRVGQCRARWIYFSMDRYQLQRGSARRRGQFSRNVGCVRSLTST
jgi:hypothetical protein